MKMVGGQKRVAVVILITIVSAAVVAWVISSLPARQVLTEEEVRQLILEHPSTMHFEVKPETIELLSVELVLVEESPLIADANKTIIYEDSEEIDYLETLPDKVWVVEYECEGRGMGIYLPEEYDPPPFTRQFVQVVIDAYTGLKISYHAEDVE